MNRRSILSATAFLSVASALGLADCSTPPTNAQVAADVGAVVAGVSAVLPTVLPMVTTPAVAAQVASYVADAQKASAALSAATTPAAASTIINQVIADIQAVAPIILAIAGLPPQTVSIINAALSLLPVIVAEVPVLVASFGATGKPLSVPVYSPDAARLILRAAQ